MDKGNDRHSEGLDVTDQTRLQRDNLATSLADLRALLSNRSPEFYSALRRRTRTATKFNELIALSTLRRRALKLRCQETPTPAATLRLAVLGGYCLYPFHELLEHLLATADTSQSTGVELFVGGYDNYVSEILDESSPLYKFRPEIVFLIPSARQCTYSGKITDSRTEQEADAEKVVSQLLQLCDRLHHKSKAEIILSNFVLPSGFDPGAYRVRTLGSDWNFRKLVNLELGLCAPPYVHICDVEFLGCRRGTVSCDDPRAWFESKQPWAADFLVDVAREVKLMIASLRTGARKVLVLDLDNTLWGGVIGDDGLEAIEIGDTSPRGEGFKAFQKFLRKLKERGVLLAVCSKNNYATAVEPFEKHPEMVLRLNDFVSFQANWEPKPDNIRRIANELNLGLDSIVFVDDNAAEVDIVRRFLPEVECVLLGPDPSDYVSTLRDARLFEPRNITAEDMARTEQYKQESARQQLLTSCTDMDSYLASLQMTATMCEITPVDVPRAAQLINKSNQFNLTTRRYTEGQVHELISDSDRVAFTVRLSDKFGDHGLIAVVIGKVHGSDFEIDTWLMSCRVLNRQVEEETLNEIVRVAQVRGCARIIGVYLPTPRNRMVHNLYPRLGFAVVSASEAQSELELNVATYVSKSTSINVLRRYHDSKRSDVQIAVSV